MYECFKSQLTKRYHSNTGNFNGLEHQLLKCAFITKLYCEHDFFEMYNRVLKACEWSKQMTLF